MVNELKAKIESSIVSDTLIHPGGEPQEQGMKGTAVLHCYPHPTQHTLATQRCHPTIKFQG